MVKLTDCDLLYAFENLLKSTGCRVKSKNWTANKADPTIVSEDKYTALVEIGVKSPNCVEDIKMGLPEFNEGPDYVKLEVLFRSHVAKDIEIKLIPLDLDQIFIPENMKGSCGHEDFYPMVEEKEQLREFLSRVILGNYQLESNIKQIFNCPSCGKESLNHSGSGVCVECEMENYWVDPAGGVHQSNEEDYDPASLYE